MSYTLLISGNVRRYIYRLDKGTQARVVVRLEELVADPHGHASSKPLHGRLEGLRSSELGGLRIIYEVDDVIRVLDVVDIGPRGDIYKR